MTRTPAPRGRHARPQSAFSAHLTRLVGDPRRRRLVLAGAGTASVAVLAAAVLLPGGGSGAPAPRATVAAHTDASAAPEPVTDPDEVPDALPYLKTKDPDGKIVGHVTEIKRSGLFLRVYTDLGESDENSKPAVSLCEWATQYLRDGGEKEPRVFVHGKSNDNGSVVLANKQSDEDDCEVGETR